VRAQTQPSDSYAFFNLLTSETLYDDVSALLPEHRERLFPPTETLSMFLAQVVSADGSCRQAVDDAAVKSLLTGRKEKSQKSVISGAQWRDCFAF
jgi:hypothetical protein